MAFATDYQDTIRFGTWLAALAGLVASGIAVTIIADDFMEVGVVRIMAASAVIGATATMALFWRLLAPSPSGFSFLRSALAGTLSAASASVLMWPPVFLTVLGPGADTAGTEPMIWILGPFYFAILAIILTGWITVPLGIIAACLVTVWARHRIGGS